MTLTPPPRGKRAGAGGVDKFSLESFRDAYVPRPSKRHARPKATVIDRQDPSLPNPRNPPSPHAKKRPPGGRGRPAGGGRKKKKVEECSDEQEESSEDEGAGEKEKERR